MILWWVCVWWLWGECADRRNRPRGQCCIWLRNWKCRGTAVQMMDRTGAWERWGGGGGGERGGDMLICILYPSRWNREEINLAEKQKDLWSHQAWWMDVTCTVWYFSAAFYIRYLIFSKQSAPQNTCSNDVHLQSHWWSKMWYTPAAGSGCLFKYWPNSQQQKRHRHSERLSLLWIILFALAIFKSLWSALPR